jgi:hypothetical protein
VPQGHRVRLADGSVINLDRAQLRSWFERGLITADSQVQSPGSSQWVRLSEVLGLKPTPPPSGPHARPPAARRRARRPVPWAGIVLGACLVAIAGAAWATADRWLPLVFGPSDVDATALPAGKPVPTASELAAEAVAREAPHLTRAVAARLMTESAAGVLEPPDAFRRAYLLAGRGVNALSRAEANEFGALNTAAYAALGARERQQLGAYIDRVRSRQPTTPAEDAAMSALMKTAVLRLSAARRARLQVLFEKAVLAGLDNPGLSSR